MMSILALVMTVALTAQIDTLVLESGELIPILEIVSVENDRILYRDGAGVLYSIPLDDVDLTATTDPDRSPHRNDLREVSEPVENEIVQRTADQLPVSGFRVSDEERDQIIREFERSAGPGTPPQLDETPSDDSEPDLTIEVTDESDEWHWRNESLRLQEQIEQAKESLESAVRRERQLNDTILYYAGNTGDGTGYSQLIYELENLRSRIPRLELAVERAEREHRRFRDEARQRGVLPGWLR